MEIEDANTLLKQAVKLGLITEPQMQEVLEETGVRNPDLQQALRQLERKAYLTPWQSNKLLKGDSDGYFLGGYRLLYKIASGSFGRVFRAHDPQSGRIVAIKVLRRRWSEDQQRIDLFVREGKVGLTLKHPSIVEIMAFNQDAATKQYYLVMEFVEGGNLREIMQIRKKLTPAEALRIIEDSAAGLTYAYARGVTHRDIKMTNLLISSQGQAKLVDFGLAQFFSSVAKTEKEKVERTVDYAGLEKATNVKFGDVRSDIFFLGCVLYEMLTGRSPMTMVRDKNQRMQSRRFMDIVPIASDEIEAPPSVYRVVETMMAIAPHQRYQTPSQLLDAVKAARRELEGGVRAAATPRTLFIVEKDERLQEKMRVKFKELGYRVLLSFDPVRALDRFRQQPYDALIVDAQTAGEEGWLVFEQIQLEGVKQKTPCAGVIIFAPEQQKEAARVQQNGMTKAFVMPNVTLKQVYRTIEKMLEEKQT